MSIRSLAPLASLAVLLAPAVALAAPEAGVSASASAGASNWAYGIGVGLTMGFGVLGAGMGQGRAVAGVLEGICRNPNSKDAAFVPMLIGLAFIESLVIFGMVMCFLLLNNIAA